jgi:hypothetical protein
MIRGARIVILAVFGVFLSAGARAIEPGTAGGPYGAIVERNVFNLHPPPKPLSEDELAAKNKPPIPKLTLTGITTILGKKVTFLTVPGTKPGTAPNYLVLAEGQAQDDVEVKEIDEKAGVVKVVNHAEPQTLDFEHDGAAKPTGPPPGAAPGAPMFPPRPAMPQPNAQPVQPESIPRPMRPFGSRQIPMSNNGGTGGGFGGGGFGPGSITPPAETQLSPEQQVALIEIQRAKFQQQGDPTANILPPTEMTPGSENAPQ